ncbi:MAG: phospholipid carrier-dependent glycosyltransferase, partial [Candidatus Limnocylindrales bacterium]
MTYTVKAGDSLISIGNRFGVPWREIYDLNRAVIGDNPRLIIDGTVLVIPNPKATPSGGATPSSPPASTPSSTPTPTPSSTPSPTPGESATPGESSSPTPSPSLSEAEQLAAALTLDPAAVQAALDASSSATGPQVLKLPPLSDSQATAVRSLMSQGLLPDVQISVPQMMVAYESGVGLLDASMLLITSTITTDAPATSIAVNYGGLDGATPRSDQSTYVAAGDSILLIQIKAAPSGTSWVVTRQSDQPLIKMPGKITKVVFDRATRIAHALGRTPDGTGWTIYAIESNGNAVFMDARLPFEPVAIGLDSSPRLSDLNREQLLAFASDGSMASVDIGQFAFSWRILGVLFGALMAVCLYLLVRLLFRRRTVGLLVALFSLTDGMLFVQSRIAMNDTYVGGFLLLAYLIFAVLWLNVSKSRIVNWLLFWLGMPILGVTLGLALASKWVAVYAIASIGVLILIRSALGRLITILGLAAGTGTLGWMAISEMTTEPDTGNPAAVVMLIGLGLAVVIFGFSWALSMRTTPDKVFIGVATGIAAAALFGAALAMSPNSVSNGAPNYTFFLVMLTITALAAAANAYHPIAWTREELWFAVGAATVLGLGAALASVRLHTGTVVTVGGIAAGPAVLTAFRFAGWFGFGPLAAPLDPDAPASQADPPAPAPEGWLRLGSGLGLPAVWMAACLLVLPLVVYVALYIPWSMPWQPQTDETGPLPAIACWHTDPDSGLCDSAWPSGHTGQNLYELTFGPYGMYSYHNDLRAPHAASSPWWAWPMDLKPVWFENSSYAGDTSTMIYDGGNPAVWWLAIFAMGFMTWQAFKRRSLGLALLAVAFFWQWLSWSRIDRATFQYHFYTALPFFLAGLAYFLAELWHGPSRRTWLLARVAGASALLFPAAIWLLKDPLCTVARVNTSDYFGNTICGSGTGDVNVETRTFLIAVVLIAALAVLALFLWRLEGRQRAGLEDPFWIVQLLVSVGIAGMLLWWLGQNGPRTSLIRVALPPDMLALVMLALGICLAIVCLLARNPRRFVLGVCVFAVAAFVALYPDLSALPLPNTILGIYDALLPTWFYGFQFSVNLQPANTPPLISGWPLVIAALMVAGLAAWAAWEHRVIVGFQRSRLL